MGHFKLLKIYIVICDYSAHRMQRLRSFHQEFHSIFFQLFTEQSVHVKYYAKAQGGVHASPFSEEHK